MTAAEPVAAPSRRRSAATWAALIGVVVIVGVALAVITGIAQLPARGLLDPDAAGPEGSRALARILEERGVDVVAVRDRDAALAALSAAPATLAWADSAALADETLASVSAAAADVVLLDPRSRDLRVLLGGATSAGYGDEPAQPGCALAEADRAGAIVPGALFAAGDDGAIACYPSGDGFGLLVADDGDRRTAAVDATVLFTNEALAVDGNASLALNLLGRHDRVVWYLPALEDSDFADSTPALGELTPPWVTPVIVLLLASTVAAAVWRGRRFGPLVPETLPVTVRAGETTEGRARLYAAADDPAHAADQLRIAALGRIARVLGLGAAATASEIADAAAARTGADRAAVRDLLIGGPIADDRALLDLADRLRAFEHRLHRALRPERNTHE